MADGTKAPPSTATIPPPLTSEAQRYVQEWFAWDIQMAGEKP